MSQVRALGQKIRISNPSRHISTIYTIGRNGESTRRFFVCVIVIFAWKMQILSVPIHADTGFLPVDITDHVHYWLRTRQQTWRVHVDCVSCGSSHLQLHTMGNKNLQPYLTLIPRKFTRRRCVQKLHHYYIICLPRTFRRSSYKPT